MKYLLMLLLLIPVFGIAAVYTQTDSNGNTIYSDTPFENSQKIEIPQSASTVTTPVEKPQVQQPAASSPTTTSAPETGSTTQTYTEFLIKSPTDQQTFQNEREIPVEVSVKPDLQKDDTIQLFIDGQAYGNPVTSTHIVTKQLDRGLHTVYVVLYNQSKSIIKKSGTIIFFVQFAHLGTGATGG